jgi:hypothetical protein
MAHRAFQDERGRQWQVWDVHPSSGIAVKPELQAGWLAFETNDEKRRLTPIPDGWEEASEPALQALLARATSHARSGRRPG